ncbi:hypothetical protein D3C81_2071820 [compost metagenome]
MNRDPHRLYLLTVDVQRAQTTRHHRNRTNEPALAADFHVIAVGNPFRRRQRFADFHKLLWLGNRIQQRVLGPGVEMFGQTIGRTNIWEVILVPHT